ncbi:MAG: hypothetical protein RIR46_887 [Actinomycetota bacterium]|jgi:hypothetical protein
MDSNGSGRIDWNVWLREIREIGFTNPLLNFESNNVGQIDLERAHPGGLAQLAASRTGVLSNLFRDPLAFSRAYSAAKRIKQRAEVLDSQFGIRCLALVGGLVNLEHDGFDLALPVLIWPLTLERKTDDFELRLGEHPRVNPGLVEALETSYGVKVDEARLLSLLDAGADLLPISVLEYLANLAGSTANLETRRILAVGTFSTESIELHSDVKRNETPLLRALAGLETEQQPASTGSLPDSEPLIVTDADIVQRTVVARAVAGESFAVETLPGCGYTQTVVNTVAGLVAANKRVLVVAPRRQTLSELADRFSDLELGGLGVRSESTWFDVIAAISRNEKAVPSNLDAALESRALAEANVAGYLDLLAKNDEKIGLSVSESLVALAKLSLMPRAPQTSARIKPQYLLDQTHRSRALELLHQAHDLGEFNFAASDTAWFQAKFETQHQVDEALELANRLEKQVLPELTNLLDSFIRKSHFRPAATVEDWGVYLKLFVGIRESLARFVPEVFDRPLDELISATGPRTTRSELSGSSRRRLKKLAKEYIRPGMSVSDLHVALIAANEQRQAWQHYSLNENKPEVPLGINEALIAYQNFVTDLGSLQAHVDDDASAKPLLKLPLVGLAKTLASMAADREPLENLEARNALREQLRELGISALARDLANLKVKREHLAAELDLSWWQSALEYLVARDASVMKYTAEQIDSIEEDFAASDTAVNLQSRQHLTHALSLKWHEGLTQHADQAANLKALLRTKQATFKTLKQAAPDIYPQLVPVVMTSPYLVSRELTEDRFDVALILDAAGTSVAENLAALQRVEQVITFGDEAIAAPDGFEVECHEFSLKREDVVPSVQSAVASGHGLVVLRKSWRPNGQALGTLINREFYQNRILFAPTAAEFLGNSNLLVEIITSGIGSSTKGTSAVESPDAEVDKVVSLVLRHAAEQPEDSLLIATASKLHADRIDQAVRIALKAKPELDEFFDSHGREKFDVTSLASLSHRVADRVIFSIGFGTDGEGRAPEVIGELGGASSRRHLANLLVSARNSITVVSCFGAEKLQQGGPLNINNLLAEILGGSKLVQSEESDEDPLLQDLSLRLAKLGARVELNLGGQIPLVVSYANKAAAVLPDWNLAGDSISERVRLRPALLKAMGWRVIRVHTFELFADPEALAIRIGESLGMQLTKRPQALFDVPAFDESDEAWGDRTESNDSRLKNDKPPHWG